MRGTLDEQESAESVWRRFVEGGSTLGPSPGVRDTWHKGRRWYAVWLVRVTDDAVIERVKRAQRALAGLIEPEAWDQAHVTMFVAGFPAATLRENDDIAEGTLLRQRTELERDPPMLRIEVGGLNAFATCAMLSVADPQGDLARVRRRFGRQGREIRFAPYHPHVTVGRFFETRPIDEIVRAIEPLRHEPPIAVRPAAVELVEVDAHGESDRLRTRWRVPCVAAPPSARAGRELRA